MSNKEKILEILSLAIDIQSMHHADDGYPYVNVSMSNYGTEFIITVNDTGFTTGGAGDCIYTFGFNNVVERTYQNCGSHLTELFDKCK